MSWRLFIVNVGKILMLYNADCWAGGYIVWIVDIFVKDTFTKTITNNNKPSNKKCSHKKDCCEKN